MKTTKKSLAYAVRLLFELLLLCVPAVFGQGNNTDATSDGTGNCICEGRGELRSDESISWIPQAPSLYSMLINETVPAGTELDITTTTCGDIQGLFIDSDECPEASWMSFCCTEEPPFYQCADQIRKSALDGYDKLTIPSNSLVYDPVKVSVQMVYHTVTAISESQGVIDIFVHLYLKWNDPRLAWEYDPSPTGSSRGVLQQGYTPPRHLSRSHRRLLQ